MEFGRESTWDARFSILGDPKIGEKMQKDLRFDSKVSEEKVSDHLPLPVFKEKIAKNWLTLNVGSPYLCY